MAVSLLTSGEADPDRYQPLAEINVTPMVDVMLVLLVIFMVTAPLLTVGVPLNLPKTSAAELQQPKEPIVVSLDREGGTFIGDEPVAAVDLKDRLARLAAEDHRYDAGQRKAGLRGGSDAQIDDANGQAGEQRPEARDDPPLSRFVARHEEIEMQPFGCSHPGCRRRFARPPFRVSENRVEHGLALLLEVATGQRAQVWLEEAKADVPAQRGRLFALPQPVSQNVMHAGELA